MHSSGNIFQSFTTLWENLYFRMSNLECSFTKIRTVSSSYAVIVIKYLFTRSVFQTPGVPAGCLECRWRNASRMTPNCGGRSRHCSRSDATVSTCSGQYGRVGEWRRMAINGTTTAGGALVARVRSEQTITITSAAQSASHMAVSNGNPVSDGRLFPLV